MIAFLLMNSIVILSAFLIVSRLLKLANIIDFLISWFIFYLAQIVFTELVLGVLGALYLKNVILINLTILFVIWLISRNQTSSFSLAGIKESVSELLKNKIILFCISIILGFGLVKICINLINPPFGWDCLNYHFVFPVEWLKHGTLDIPITISDDPSPSYYPINGSLFFLWLILPFKNVFLADLGQLPFFILAFLATYNISRKIGLNKELSFYAAALFLITPNFFKQLEIAYVDVMLAALFLTSINFLLVLYRDFQLKNLILWTVSFGLFLGIKTSAVIYGILPFLFFIWILLKTIKKVHIKKIVFYLALFIFLVSILGGFTYIRNFIQTDNPLFPADIELFGRKVFKGVMPFSTYRNRWTKEEFNLEKFLFHEGMGLQFILLVIPGILLSLPLIFIKRRKDINSSLIFVLSLPILLYLSFWFFMPQLWVRYLYPFLGVSFIVAIYTLDLLNIPTKILKVLVIICFLASMGELSGHTELISSIILSILLFFIILPKILKLKFNLRFTSTVFLLIIPVSIYLNSNYNKYEFSRYLLRSPFPIEEKQAWVWLNDNTIKNSKIAYVGRPDVLPLYGTNFKNDVYYISVNKIHPVKLHYFPKAKYVWIKDFMTLHKNLEMPGNYRGNADYSAWIKNLESENINYLLIYSLHQVKNIVFPLEDKWASTHDKIFNSVFKNDTVHIYKIIK